MTGRYKVVGPDGEILVADVDGEQANAAAAAAVDAEIVALPDIDQVDGGQELLTTREASDEIGCNIGTVQRTLRKGSLTGIRLPSGTWRIPRESLAGLL